MLNSVSASCMICLVLKRSISGNTKLTPVDPDDILRSYEVNQSVCARNYTYNFITCILKTILETHNLKI